MPRLYAAGRRQSRQILATHFREKSAYLTSAISSSCRSYCFLFLATYPGLEPALFDAVMRTYLACGQGNFGLDAPARRALPERVADEEGAERLEVLRGLHRPTHRLHEVRQRVRSEER